MVAAAAERAIATTVKHAVAAPLLAEPIGPSTRLANREVGRLPGHRRLSFVARQLRRINWRCTGPSSTRGGGGSSALSESALSAAPAALSSSSTGGEACEGSCAFDAASAADNVSLGSAACVSTAIRLGTGSPSAPTLAGSSFLRNRGGSGLLVVVFSVAGRAACETDVFADHRDDGVIRQATLTRTVVIQNVTKPRLALLHQECSRRTLAGGEKVAKGEAILAELDFPRQA